MDRRMRMSKRFIKVDRGGPKPTWRMASEFDHGITAIRKLSNKLSKRFWLSGSSIKAY